MSQDIFEQVQAEFTCRHDLVRLTFIRSVSGTVQYRKQCLECGVIVGKSAIPYDALEEAEKEGAIPFNRDLERRYSRSRNARFIELHTAKREAEQDAWWERYDAYLRSPEWKARRAKVLERDPVCRGCGVRPSTQVHHLTYDRVTREMLFDLVGICADCHEAIHPHMAEKAKAEPWAMTAVGT